MFETAITDGAKKLGLQQEVAETGRVNTNITALLVDVAGSGELALLAVGGGGGLVAANLLVGVINEIFFVRHGCVCGYVDVGKETITSSKRNESEVAR